jgi:hypothetical protein
MSASFYFFNDPYLVLMCFPSSSGAMSYDILYRHYNGGYQYNEIFYSVGTSNCAGNLGTGQRANNIYIDYIHISVRACNSSGCSGWTDMITPYWYWAYLPCYSPSGCYGGGTPLSNGHSH